ncbi:MAG: hypothetical protein J7L96_07300, partial [Bacteroidales bacterium]|nr:hypothetical protein [Bacteroidales bacterium]
TPSGILTLKCEVFQNKIKSASITGDFIIPDHRILREVIAETNDRTFSQATEAIKKSKLPDDIINGLVQLIKQLNS